MKIWAAIFNVFSVILMMIMLIVYYNTAVTNEREFELARLNKAMQYSAEAAFQSALKTEDLGIDYTDIGAVMLNPGDSMDIFESVMCLNYNMSLSDDNKVHIESYIPTAVLACNDGYYILTMSEVDTTPTNGVKGEEYKLRWSVKKPYTIKIGSTLYSVNLNNQNWYSARDNSGNLELMSGVTYQPGIDKNLILRAVNTKITKDMIYQISIRNFDKKSWDYKFYLPPSQTTTGVNAINKPSLLVFMQGVDFAGTQKLDAVNVAGLKTIRKKVVVAYKDPVSNIKYYCYEGQLPSSMTGYVENYYTKIEDAAQAGYVPNYDCLQKKIDYDK